MADETMNQVQQWRERHVDAYRELAWISGVVDSGGAETMSPDPDMRVNRIDHVLSRLDTLMRRAPEGPDKPDEQPPTSHDIVTRGETMPTVEQEWALIVKDAEVLVELSELPKSTDSDHAHARRKLAYLAAFRDNRLRRGFTEEALPWPRWAGDYESSLRYARTLKWEQDQERADTEHGAEMETRKKLMES